MRRDIPDFLLKSAQDQALLGEEGVHRLLDAGRAWDLAPVLRAGGAVIFPHTSIATCGHQVAAAVHACLDSGASRVLAIGVLHALTQVLEEARVQVANGEDPFGKPAWGIQGPGLAGREDWRAEFSLSHFQFLWKQEIARRGIPGPELIVRYPYLAGGRPDLLPGIAELHQIAQEAVVVATMDPFHHGIGYGDLPDKALAPTEGGLELARQAIAEGLTLQQAGEYWRYNQHCVRTKSDGRDVGQVVRHLLGPQEGRILDLIADDMSVAYHKPTPTWVAGALIALQTP
ncbi:MAG: hypothetical protein JWL77_1903 [Chthonomonadaceae bacterium]|nr:hypothetical protein [Chthonomonadaceae bacterium]